MKERLEQFLATKGYTSQRFAEIMGVQPSGISHILAGRNKPRFDFLERLLRRFPEISPDWLLLGKGPMFRETVLAGGDAARNAVAYASELHDDKNGNMFPDFGKEDDIVDTGFIDQEEPFEELSAHIDGEAESDPVAGSLFEGARAESVTNNSDQITDNSGFTEIIESKGTDTVRPLSHHMDNHFPEDTHVTESKHDTSDKSCVTNVIQADRKPPKIVKIVLLYDNGSFESYENK